MLAGAQLGLLKIDGKIVRAGRFDNRIAAYISVRFRQAGCRNPSGPSWSCQRRRADVNFLL